MKKISISLLIVSLLSLYGVQAQNTSLIEFEKATHEFGKLEKNAPAEYTFTFTNTSEKEIKLQNVKASCGCTTPNWTKEAVQPGEKGEIKVKYNTARIGPFRKSITVTYAEGIRPEVLYISGEVKPANEDINFRSVVGGTSFDRVSQHVNTLDSDKSTDVTFKVKNTSPKPIEFKNQMEKGEMFDVAISKALLAPGEIAEIKVKVLGDKFEKGGDFAERITLFTTDTQVPAKVLAVSGKINKKYTAEELATLPKLSFQQTDFKGGTVIEGEKVTYKYAFTNEGQGDLVIESVKASCGCTASAPKDKIIKGGQTSEIEATFNSKGRVGAQRKSITVKTNDPEQPTVVLTFQVQVERDPFAAESAGPAAIPGPGPGSNNQ